MRPVRRFGARRQWPLPPQTVHGFIRRQHGGVGTPLSGTDSVPRGVDSVRRGSRPRVRAPVPRPHSSAPRRGRAAPRTPARPPRGLSRFAHRQGVEHRSDVGPQRDARGGDPPHHRESSGDGRHRLCLSAGVGEVSRAPASHSPPSGPLRTLRPARASRVTVNRPRAPWHDNWMQPFGGLGFSAATSRRRRHWGVHVSDRERRLSQQ